MKHHVEMENLDYIQIHPTTLYSKKPGRRFLVSESVRGEGALLYDKNGQRFTNELQPRDLLSQKIFAQMEKDGTEFVWEDMRPLGEKTILEHFPHIYEQCVEEGFDPRKEPIPVVPAQHYFMGGIWVDYELMTSIKGLFAIGECNFSDHGANRLGASALMQGLADGYFVLPYTIQNYLADQITVPRFSTDLPEFAAAEKAVQEKIDWMMNIKGKKSVDSIHKELGHIMWEYVGMGRTAEGLKEGLKKLKEVRKEFEKELFIPGDKEGMNVELDKAIRLYDFITMGELVAYDALNRNESCGGHFREEYQTEEGEAKRDDENYFYVACWEYQGSDEKEPVLLKEPLVYEAIKVQTRNYKS